MTETILVLNSGSSSIKFQLFAASARELLERRMKG
jgi:acetate kinase